MREKNKLRNMIVLVLRSGGGGDVRMMKKNSLKGVKRSRPVKCTRSFESRYLCSDRGKRFFFSKSHYQPTSRDVAMKYWDEKDNCQPSH